MTRHTPYEPTALDITEWLLAWDRAGRPQPKWTVTGRLFQAAMWREYAMTWHGRATRSGVDQRWCEQIGRMTYEGCLRRARVSVYLARRLNRKTSLSPELINIS